MDIRLRELSICLCLLFTWLSVAQSLPTCYGIQTNETYAGAHWSFFLFFLACPWVFHFASAIPRFVVTNSQPGVYNTLMGVWDCCIAAGITFSHVFAIHVWHPCALEYYHPLPGCFSHGLAHRHCPTYCALPSNKMPQSLCEPTAVSGNRRARSGLVVGAER